jgi:hypothetical protein
VSAAALVDFAHAPLQIKNITCLREIGLVAVLPGWKTWREGLDELGKERHGKLRFSDFKIQYKGLPYKTVDVRLLINHMQIMVLIGWRGCGSGVVAATLVGTSCNAN